jgi:hypothetical protein
MLHGVIRHRLGQRARMLDGVSDVVDATALTTHHGAPHHSYHRSDDFIRELDCLFSTPGYHGSRVVVPAVLHVKSPPPRVGVFLGTEVARHGREFSNS